MVKRSPTRKTLASLAAELGVSRTTVSNAYSRPDQLSPATRERILAAAKARGYPGPDPTARSLRTRRAGSVGVLLTEHLSYAFEDMASVDFLAGMAEASAGAQTTLTLIPAGPEGEAEATSLVGSAAVDGFVVYSVAAGDAYLAAARGRGLPLVVCDQPTDAGLPFVGIDDRAAIAPAARALIDAGHRHIGILAIRLRLQRHDGPISWQEVQDAEMHVQRSRVMGAVASGEHLSAAARWRQLLARYGEVEFLLQVGEYKAGADPLADTAIARIEDLRGFLRQPEAETTTFEETVAWMQRLAA